MLGMQPRLGGGVVWSNLERRGGRVDVGRWRGRNVLGGGTVALWNTMLCAEVFGRVMRHAVETVGM